MTTGAARVPDLLLSTLAAVDTARVWIVDPATMAPAVLPDPLAEVVPAPLPGGAVPVVATDRMHLLACIEQAQRRGRAEATVTLAGRAGPEALPITAVDLAPAAALVAVVGGAVRAARSESTVTTDAAVLADHDADTVALDAAPNPRRDALLRDLPLAAERRELFLDFQPVHDLHSLTPVGAEALMRWQHPQRGLLRPHDFIPLAEESGIIADLGWWLADQAVRALVAMRAAFDGGTRFSMAINVSGRQLNDRRLVADLERVVTSHEIDPVGLTVELTETALMAGEEGIDALHGIADLGCRIAIDGFGTGYASLDMLSRLPIAAVKLDHSFTHRIEQPRVARLVRAVLSMCREVGVELTAEGIETTQQLRRLRDAGVAYGQGYVLGRPASLDSLIGEEAAAGVTIPAAHPELLTR